MMRRLLHGLVSLAAGVAFAVHAESDRDRLEAERSAATARLAEKEQACQGQFVVTPCVEAAQREHSLTMKRLRQRQLALDDAERHDAAARRRQAIAEHSAAQAARASEPAPATAPRDGARRTPAPNPPAASGASGLGLQRTPQAAAEQRAAERRNEAAFEAKARAAQAHRDAVERRNAERAAAGKVAAPLPVPSGASAP